MHRQPGRSIRERVILAVFALLLVAVIAAQALPNQARSAPMDVSGQLLSDHDGLLTGRFAAQAVAGILSFRRATVNVVSSASAGSR